VKEQEKFLIRISLWWLCKGHFGDNLTVVTLCAHCAADARSVSDS